MNGNAGGAMKKQELSVLAGAMLMIGMVARAADAP